LKKSLKIYLIAAFFLFVFLLISLVNNYGKLISIEEIIFFIISLFIVSNMSILMNSSSDFIISMNIPVLLPTFALLSPLGAAVTAALGTIEWTKQRNHFVWYKFLFNRIMFFVAAGIGGIVFEIINNSLTVNYQLISLFIAALAYFFVNNALVYIVVKLSKNGRESNSFLVYLAELVKNLITSYFLGVLLYYSYIEFGKLFFILVIILLYILKDFFYSRIQQLNSYTQIIESFLKVIDSKDHYTEGHCMRVAEYTSELSNALKLSSLKREKIISVAKIHDIGKIGVSDKILKSSEKLTIKEYEEIKKHTTYGYELLKDIDLVNDQLDIILYHHERFDGTGYPKGIKAKNIPIGARILSVCDAFDVMTRGRKYKAAMSKAEIIKEFKECAGTQFDPDAVEAMLKLIERGTFDHCFLEKEIVEGLDVQAVKSNY